MCFRGFIYLVPEGGFEPPRLAAADFESAMSAVPSLGRIHLQVMTCKNYNSTDYTPSSRLNFDNLNIKKRYPMDCRCLFVI